ncbi:MAG: AAA family ATPase [Gammaproteobacteria bacterium]|nr:AAA family ATPase [Gammaproteobacteria bacterium]
MRKSCDLEGLDFESSADITPSAQRIGQQRAVGAIQLGLEISDDGHNIFVLGPTGSNRHGLVEELVRERASRKPTSDDWCYVNNFADPERPRHLRFPPGRGSEFTDSMRSLVTDLQLAIPEAFEGDEYRAQLTAIEDETQREVESRSKDLEERARKENIAVMQTPTGYVLAPVRDGKVMDEEEFSKQPDEFRKSTKAAIERLSDELRKHIEEMPKVRKRHRERVKALNREITEHAVSVSLGELIDKYRDLPDVVAHLEEVHSNIIENAEDFQSPATPSLPFLQKDAESTFGLYDVNLLISNEPSGPAPVVYEPNPNYGNILGKIEHRAEMGALVTDFRMIRPGALHGANGGYLILDMRRVLTRPFVWEALKQALFAKQLRIESPGETYGLVSTTTLRPQPIPLDVKVVLIGERWLFHLLAMYDSEFGDLFKVAADLDDELERSGDNEIAFVHQIADRVHQRGLQPFDRAAVEKIVEQRSRHANDGERLSMHMSSLEDLLTQANYWATQSGSDTVRAQDVRKAVDEMALRLGRIRGKLQDAIQRDILLIDTSGSFTGQVNGLSVVQLGEYRFGHATRITATTRIGSGRVIDIEREVKLGGPIHSKGVMILSAALAARYARDVPLSLNAHIVFEQSYGGVEGDSASVAELCALLSSIADVPLQQNIAVTGSVNQLGRVQVVGGVNEKIEGFYDLCNERGLDGSHGVILPRDNVKHLMLREDIVEAAADGRFSVYAVADIDEALTILTGEDAGKRDANGEFPEGSVNDRVEKQLARYASLRQRFSKSAETNEGT